jgi:hypothetical protein
MKKQEIDNLKMTVEFQEKIIETKDRHIKLLEEQNDLLKQKLEGYRTRLPDAKFSKNSRFSNY